MLDEFTLEEVIKYIENRIKKMKSTISIYKKDSTNYLIYKNLIMTYLNITLLKKNFQASLKYFS